MRVFSRFLRWFVLPTAILLFILSIPEMVHKNHGESEAIGSVRDGRLNNGFLLPWRGHNFTYFSFLSYYILNYGYVHSTVHDIVIDAYQACEYLTPGVRFKLMDCSRRRGGRMLVHWTHQNGTSVDFMVVKKDERGEQHRLLDRTGLFHYGLGFDEDGRSTLLRNVTVDFETMGIHILALADAAEAHGMRIRKIIMKVEYLDELFATSSGREIRDREIFIVPRLPDVVNDVHDDHYHVDFVFTDID